MSFSKAVHRICLIIRVKAGEYKQSKILFLENLWGKMGSKMALLPFFLRPVLLNLHVCNDADILGYF